MRLTKLSVIAFLLISNLTFPAFSLRAQDANDSDASRRGTAPRSSAGKHHTHATNDGVSIGAELLTRKQVSQEFAARLNSCCLVVQVAVYPKKDEPLDLSPYDFALFVGETDIPIRPQSATVISAKLEKQPSKSVATYEGVGIGYESGTYIDPVTGQPVHVHGTTTSTGAGVAVGDAVPPAVAEREREVIERELSEKGLPEAKVAIPVSGYLYFSVPKQKKDTKYRLEYVVKGEILTLQLK